MIRQVRTVLYLAIAAVVLGIACFMLRPQHSDGLAHVYMLNVGQGDSFLVQSADGRQLLIDGGRDSSVMMELAQVMPRGDRTIDAVIATHPDADHIGGLPMVLSRYKVGVFLTTDAASDSTVYKTMMQTLADKRIPSYYARRGMNIALDQTQSTNFKILFPDRSTKGWETNTASVVARLDAGDASALFTGDSPSSIEHFLTTVDPKGINVDLLKLGHHGSKTSSSDEFLKATSPTLALISAGVGNSYGHPHKEVLDRLRSLDIPWTSTQDSGTVGFTTDGTTWEF